MILKRLQLKSLWLEPTNCYIIQDEESKETMVIDPAGELDKILEMLDILNSKLKTESPYIIELSLIEQLSNFNNLDS